MTSLRFGRRLMAAALASATLLAAGCATETTYRPATGYGFNRTGYSERMVEPGRWFVSFAGNTVTPRDTVERYLLFRSAELTLQQGNDYFVMVDRDTDRQTRTYSTPGFGYSGGFGGYGGFGYGRGFGFGGYWGPSWRYHGIGGGWGGWGGGFGDPFFDGPDIQTVDRVEAEAQIVMRRGPIPTGNVRAFDAHAVVRTLGPSIILPKDGRGRAPAYGAYGQPGQPGQPGSAASAPQGGDSRY
ncbi:MAG: CC0125/CC1285 family lipoprotein [Janthinobacterium lividum]